MNIRWPKYRIKEIIGKKERSVFVPEYRNMIFWLECKNADGNQPVFNSIEECRNHLTDIDYAPKVVIHPFKKEDKP